mmetsp:Transcript_25286/g.39090  ORF Transcript_25286/g.39090 Transcript_25286/m.39090 type:complete len:118 (+) Transcript_25286:1480-1833(+)
MEAGAGNKYKNSQVAQKGEIYNKINDMHYSMKSFTLDIENKLNAAYGEKGASAKFGFDDVISSGRVSVAQDSDDDEIGGHRKTKSERKIEKLATQANRYLKRENERSETSSIISGHS